MQNSNILHLTDAETTAFNSLSDALREGWKFQPETLTYKDSPKNREIRFMISRFHDPKLLQFCEDFKAVKSDDDFMKLLSGFDFGALSETDLGQVTFALGPDALSAFILGALAKVESDEDLILIGNFTELRHELLESLTIIS